MQIELGYAVAQLVDASGQSGETERIGGADGDDGVGALECPQGDGVSPRRRCVVRELLVDLETEPDVDDHDGRHLAGRLENAVERADPQLRPAICAANAGEESQRRTHLAYVTRQIGEVERTRVRTACRREQATHLVEHGEQLRDRTTVGVGVDEQRRCAAVGRLRG